VLQAIEGLPSGVIGFRAEGKVTSDDYAQTLAPAVRQEIAAGRKLRLLLELGPDFEGYDIGAMFADAKMGIEDFKSFEKLAVVTDNSMFRTGVEMFARLMPAAVQVFSVADVGAAKTWISA
jgi:hypothetical protein